MTTIERILADRALRYAAATERVCVHALARSGVRARDMPAIYIGTFAEVVLRGRNRTLVPVDTLLAAIDDDRAPRVGPLPQPHGGFRFRRSARGQHPALELRTVDFDA